MKTKIIKLGNKDFPVRIWVGNNGFYIEYFPRKFGKFNEKEMEYTVKIEPQNWKRGTPIFFGYLKDVVAYALKHTEFLAGEKQELKENTIPYKEIDDTSSKIFNQHLTK